MITTANITTAEQLLRAGDIGRCELVRGELSMMSPSGFKHVAVAATIAHLLISHVKPKRLGTVVGAEGGFFIERDPDTVRAPDAAFVKAERVGTRLPSGFFPGPPDLAVEVLSPNDTATEVLAKTRQWLDAGTLEVWLVDPERKTVAIHRSDAPVKVYDDGDVISSESLLPGLAVHVGDIFA